jgi:glucan phosphoethanolaminetransferase (alkaline phosphatase superfamily)
MTNYGYLISSILAAILFLVAVVYITLAYSAANKAFKDSENTNFASSASTATTYLLISTFISWVFLLINVTAEIVAYIHGTFQGANLSKYLNTKNLDENGLLGFISGTQMDSATKRNLIIMITIIVVTIVAILIVAILALLGSINIGKVTISSDAPKAQSHALIGSICAFGAMALYIISVVFLFQEYSAIVKELKESATYSKENIKVEQVKTAEVHLETKEESLKSNSTPTDKNSKEIASVQKELEFIQEKLKALKSK